MLTDRSARVGGHLVDLPVEFLAGQGLEAVLVDQQGGRAVGGRVIEFKIARSPFLEEEQDEQVRQAARPVAVIGPGLAGHD